MRVKLTFPDDDAFKNQCQRSLQAGLMFFPSAEVCRSGVPVCVEAHVEKFGLVLEMNGLVAGISVLPERDKSHSGLWIQLEEATFLHPSIESWFKDLPAPIQIIQPKPIETKPEAPIEVPVITTHSLSLQEQIWDDEFEWLESP